MPRWRGGILTATVLLAAACSSGSTGESGAGGTGTTAATAAASATGPAAPIVFNAQGNNLDAYAATPPFTHQRVNKGNKPSKGDEADPAGWDINGQICFTTGADGRQLLIAGEDTGQPTTPAGWGIFELRGRAIGDLSVQKVAKLVPTYQPGAMPDNYGCGVLSDGRVVTTDIGNEAGGAANGQLTVWFPPFDSERVAFCKLDLQLATGQQVFVDRSPDLGDVLYVVSPRPSDQEGATAGGVFRYPGPFPTSADVSGGCGKTDNVGSPLADILTKEKVLAAGDHGLVSPSGITRAPNGHWFVSSVITGSINEYDGAWGFVQTVLQPPAGEVLGAEPFSTGTPLGIDAAPDGSLFYADIGIVVEPDGIGPGERTGNVRRIAFTGGVPQPPEVVAADLNFPDGIGIWTPG